MTFLPESSTAGAPRDAPTQNLEDALESCRGGAKGESAEGREKPPWGVPLPQAGLGPAPTIKKGRLLCKPQGRASSPARQVSDKVPIKP